MKEQLALLRSSFESMFPRMVKTLPEYEQILLRRPDITSMTAQLLERPNHSLSAYNTLYFDYGAELTSFFMKGRPARLKTIFNQGIPVSLGGSAEVQLGYRLSGFYDTHQLLTDLNQGLQLGSDGLIQLPVVTVIDFNGNVMDSEQYKKRLSLASFQQLHSELP